MGDLPRSRGTEPIEGWRLWRLGLDEAARPRLLPAGSGSVDAWVPREAARARCGVPALIRRSLRPHPAPDLRCICGIYAGRGLGQDAREVPAWPSAPVAGTVALWGRVIEHERGWRGALGYPARLTLVCSLCVGLEPGPGVPAVVHRFAGELYPLCTVHRGGAQLPDGRRTQPTGLDPVALRSDLLATYAVDLLPFDTLDALRSRPAAPKPAAFIPRILALEP
jgi:hypothetical protein